MHTSLTSRNHFSLGLVMFQSTHRQEDAGDKRNRFHNAVSIHAQEIYNDLDGEVVFQSMPREGTTAATIATASLTQFRSMSPRDEVQTPFMTMTKQFSIHAPARGAT
jgi:hypothetical protein